MTGEREGRWFRPEILGTPQALTIGQLEYYKRKAAESGEDEIYHPGQTWLLGYAIPPFQRPRVWELERKVRFIESAASGLHLGTWVYNDAGRFPMERAGGIDRLARTDRWLIDGQQRFDALDAFFDDGFPVFGSLWSEVSSVDRRRFLNQNFAAHMISTNDEMELRRLYDRLNFGGVPHAPDQRAVPEEEDEAAPSPGMR